MTHPTTTVDDLDAAMRRALALAALGPAHGPNPRVGCVLLAPPEPGTTGRRVIGEGFHRGAGTRHGETDALADAAARGEDPRGATAVVTLEPCDHVGRTGACSVALLEAGVAEVVHAIDDPNPRAAGGAARLAANGVRVCSGLLADEARALVEPWAVAVDRGTPFVTLKLPTSLDGRVAAADGTSRWITSAASRRWAHDVRARVDAIAVTTGTALADDPELTARDASGAALPHQPLRVVVGHRDLPPAARLHGPGGDLVRIRSHDVADVLAELAEREVRHLLVEGGPALATAFLRADAVDELQVQVAPLLIGSGPTAIGDLGVATLADATRWRTTRVDRLGDDVLLTARRGAPPSSPAHPDAATDGVATTIEEGRR